MLATPAAADLLECPVCLQTFEDPQLLGDCGHTFCQRCVAQLNPPRCPTCRRAFRRNGVLPNFALRHLLGERALASSTGGNTIPDPGRVTTTGDQNPVGQLVEPRDTARTGLNLDVLMSLGLPAGLARLVQEEDKKIAMRIFLLDNSGSTAHPDGKILDHVADGAAEAYTFRRCTRWEEVAHMALQHARWNATVGTPCEFVLLNPAASTTGEMEEGLDYQRVDASSGDSQAQLASLERLLASSGPKGATPLTDRLRRIHDQIMPQARSLALSGQKVVLVIATDGLPSGRYGGCTSSSQQDMVSQLRRMSTDLPIHMVIRLCTDEDNVVDFYNKIDEELEIQLEVIDDICGEAKETWRAGNRWLTYSPLVHQLREGGTFLKVFDLLDERRLDPMEVCLLCQLLLRQDKDDEPLSSDPYQFCDEVRARLSCAQLVYDAWRKKMSPPIWIHEVEWAVLPKAKLRRDCGEALTSSCAVL